MRVQAAVRALRGARGGESARAHDQLHQVDLPERHRHPGFQARRHRQHGRAIRARSLRALRRGCRDRESLSRPRFGGALPQARRQGRHHSLPHQQSRREGFPGSECRARKEVVSPRRRASGEGMEHEWQLHAGGGRHVSGRARRYPRARRRSAIPGAGRRRAGRRRCEGDGGRQDGRGHGPRDQLVARHSLRELGG